MSTVITIVEIFACWVALSLVLLYSTWVHFAAIMRMRALRDSGEVNREKDRVLWACGTFMLLTGWVLDAAVQFIVMSPVMLEAPIARTERGWRIEWLTTSRFIRWNRSRSASWWTRKVRKPVVNLGKMLLDKVDTDGLHIQ